MGREDYIAIAGDDWYQRRRQDAEGEFFITVANQSPRKGEGGATRQGIYCLTAGGHLLAYKNAGQNAQVMREVLQQGLQVWKKLPESQRAPGAVKVPDQGPVDETYYRQPPRGGLIANVSTRALDRADSSGYSDAVCKAGRGDEAARDHLWLTEAEWKSLAPANAKKGERFPLPTPIAERLLRFHLVDNTRGEPPSWHPDEIRSNNLSLVVEKSTRSEALLRLEGTVLLATDADASKARRGYDAYLLGWIQLDRKKGTVERFDIVAIGEHWGEGSFTRGARPGRTPLGVAFDLVRGDSPADHVAPQGARELSDYFGRAR